LALGIRLRQPHAAYLGNAEHRVGHDLVVHGALVAGEDVIHRHLSLARGHVGQHVARQDVADSIDAGDARLQELVHRDARIAPAHADLFQP